MEQKRIRRRVPTEDTSSIIQPKVSSSPTVVDMPTRTRSRETAVVSPSKHVKDNGEEKLYSAELFGTEIVDVMEFKGYYDCAIVDSDLMDIPVITHHINPSPRINELENLCREVSDNFSAVRRKRSIGGYRNE